MDIKDKPETLSDEALASQMQAGNCQAFDTLCDRYLSHFYKRLWAQLPPEAVEDIVQDVFLAALRSIRRYRERASFKTWLTAIARHKTADYYRKRERQPEIKSLEFQILNFNTTNSINREHIAVRLALQNLHPIYREILLLRFVYDLPFKQIANTLNISLEAAKSRYRRAIISIRKLLQSDTESVD